MRALLGLSGHLQPRLLQLRILQLPEKKLVLLYVRRQRLLDRLQLPLQLTGSLLWY